MPPSVFRVLAVMFALAGVARADVVYSSYPSTVTASGYEVGNPPNILDIAASFVPTANFTFDSATLGLYSAAGGNNYTVALAKNNGANGPGAFLESFDVSALTSGPPALTVSSSGHPELDSGQTYWLEVRANGDSRGYWTVSDAVTTGYDYSLDGATWTTQPGGAPAFEIDGTPIPTPAPLAVFGGISLIIGLAVASRRRLLHLLP